MIFAADVRAPNQRWRAGRNRYRPAGEVINPREYEVAPIARDRVAKDFIVRLHYSSSYVAARFRYGLYRRGRLVGVAVFSHPCNDLVLKNTFPGEPLESCELGRFVLTDCVEGNGESFFAARCFELLRREGIVGVVSFSDPEPRTTEAGDVVFRGHIGTIYQALSARFLGRATPRTLRLLPDGTVFNDRSAQKIRGGERGWESAAEVLRRFGATEPPRDAGARVEWLAHWRERLTRRLKHPGNFKYVWGFDRATRRALPPSLPYPKITRAQLELWN